ncbi:hypothetical protein CCH79_00004663 [Gambusia affinis]|uniref:Arginine/serine-rich protein 1 n=1 Tax=Gambusia affinis TaxID=33528 RepID=A0A315UYC7_GAMAF|nr:hypothetical protein CCH79_00004663 [Gambusia affinis]
MTYRGRSRSRSSGRSVSLSLRDKRELLEVAKANAMRMLGVEKLDLPESVKPILSEQPAARRSSPEPVTGVRHGSQKTHLENLPLAEGAQACGLHYNDYSSQDNPSPYPKDKLDEAEPGVSSPRIEGRKIAFSVNNSVAKPTVVTPSPAKVTPRVDSVESRKPYGHWIPISSGQNINVKDLNGKLRRIRSATLKVGGSLDSILAQALGPQRGAVSLISSDVQQLHSVIVLTTSRTFLEASSHSNLDFLASQANTNRLLQNEELLLKRRHPDYTLPSLD